MITPSFGAVNISLLITDKIVGVPERCGLPSGTMSEMGVRRDKAALSSGCKSHPANAPAGAAMEVTK